MTVSREDVAKVALLARLTIPDESLSEVTERFGRVLELVDELNSIDTDTTQPMSNPHDMHQRLRVDVITADNQRQALMASAPAQEHGYYLVPKVID